MTLIVAAILIAVVAPLSWLLGAWHFLGVGAEIILKAQAIALAVLGSVMLAWRLL